MPGLQDALIYWLAKMMPPEAIKLVENWMENMISVSSGSLLSIGLLGALWAASKGMKSLIFALNTAYGVEVSYVKTRLIAPLLTLALAVFIVGGQILIMFGDWLAIGIAGILGLDDRFAVMWRYVDYMLGILLLIIGVGLIYHFAPNRKQKFRLITPGAIFAVSSSIIVSIFFSLYLRYVPKHNVVYGSLGAVVVLLLWLYMMGLLLFMGGVINSVIERADGMPVSENGTEEQYSTVDPKMKSTGS